MGGSRRFTRNVKIAVYTIAKNEEQFVERWYESAKDADYLLIADTGSTDGTVEKAKSLGINVVNIHINPWRFDDARNASLAVLPADIDYCIQLDMDEVLVGDYRKHLQTALKQNVTHPKYHYVFSWNDDGTPAVNFTGFKIHPRNNTRWKYPIHEAPYQYGSAKQKFAWFDFAIHHFPDKTKSRSQYLPMLQEAVTEYPNDSRMEYYLGREYYFNQQWDKALEHLSNAIELGYWHLEDACDYAAIAAYNAGNKELALQYGKKALELNPSNERLQGNIAWYER